MLMDSARQPSGSGHPDEQTGRSRVRDDGLFLEGGKLFVGTLDEELIAGFQEGLRYGEEFDAAGSALPFGDAEAQRAYHVADGLAAKPAGQI